MNRLATYICVATLTSGCASLEAPKGTVAKTNEYQRYSQVDRETKTMLSRINESLAVLAETRQGAAVIEATPEEMRQREWLFSITPPGMGVPMTINNWRGHPEVIIDMIAASTGYHVETIGIPSPSVNNVSASYISRPAVEVLRAVATQAGCDALVDVQSANRKIVVDWTIRKRGGCS